MDLGQMQSPRLSGNPSRPFLCRLAAGPAPVSLILKPIEWKAERISDPAEKLRYLRRTIGRVETIRRWPVRLAGAAAAVALTYLSISSITKATSFWKEPAPAGAPVILSAVAAPSPATPDRVWMVEKKDEFEVYSNGLRIETKGAANHSPRLYLPLDRKHPEAWTRAGSGVAAKYAALQSQPVGIVFHTTESDLAPFDPSQNTNLKRLAQDIVTYVRRHKSYHYLVDRFGRVHRVVEESSIANHAGHSIWGDADHLYVNLNNSFFGIAFEAQTRPQDGTETINQAQLHAGRVLTDMLRSKYGIAAEDCITHSQVSVNPDNFRIGAHTDWATRFPYAEMGLPDNYAIPVPSITGFGFSYDNSFVNASEARLWKGLLIAQEELRQAAKAQGVTLISYRAALHRRYKEIIEAWKTPPKQESL